MKYCIANWKMNMNHHQANSYIEKLYGLMYEEKNNNNALMIICPPYTLLDFIWYNEMFIAMSNKEILVSTPELGVQNINPNNEGAYTGEISPAMIKSYCDGEWEPMGFVANWAIVGHSERRILFHESNDFINSKVKSALDNDIRPILCIGESLDERESGRTEEILHNQLKECLKNISCPDEDFLIAYEPVWAIGTGKTADNNTIELGNNIILNIIKELKCDIKNPKILYGGSVNNNNAKNLSKICNLDGFLIGGASLDVEQFYSIYNVLKGE